MDAHLQERIKRMHDKGIILKQHIEEVAWTWQTVQAHCGLLDTFVEIGSMDGASLYIYAGLLAESGGMAIGIDNGKRSPHTRSHLKAVIHRLRDEGVDAHWIRGNSHHADTQKQLAKLLGDRKINLLHIDGDHSADGSWQDWVDYHPLVRPGGIVAMHDIRATLPCNVIPTWRTICDAG